MIHNWNEFISNICSAAAAAPAKSCQSCPTLCDPIDGIPPGSPVPGILQARTLEWVAISFSNAWKWKVKVKSFSRLRLLATPWTAAQQAPPFMGFSKARVLEWVAIAFSGQVHWGWAKETPSTFTELSLHHTKFTVKNCDTGGKGNMQVSMWQRGWDSLLARTASSGSRIWAASWSWGKSFQGDRGAIWSTS